MLLKLMLLLLVALAVLAVESNRLRVVVIYLGIFSMVSSFVYFLYGSPDVAMAEAIIGSTLSSILFVVAIKKYSVFSIYCLQGKETHSGLPALLAMIESFCIDKELEPQIVTTPEDKAHVVANHAYDLIVEPADGMMNISGNRENYHLDELYLKIGLEHGDDIDFVREDLQ